MKAFLQSAARAVRSQGGAYFLALAVLLIVNGVIFVGVGADECPVGSDEDTNASPQQVSLPEPPKRHTLDVKNPSGNTFQITVSSPGPPYPSHVKLTWTSPNYTHASHFETSHLDQVTNAGANDVGGRVVEWTLPVNQNTGRTDTVTMSYDSFYPNQPRVDYFQAESDLYPQDSTQAITRPAGVGGQAAASAWPPPASSPTAQSDRYYRWQVWVHFTPTEARTMTAALCQEQMALLQGGHAFVALRFPVLPPALSSTAPYTLPVVAGLDTPRLVLNNESGWPATSVLTVPLEYKPEYLLFLENELPAVPGEHWLALGAVTTPTVDCASLPPLPHWSFEAEVWLDFGGAQDAGRGRVLPCYYCYEGQAPPATLLGADAASYQGWGITCLGPHSFYLESHVRPLELYGMHTAWVTPTQTISLPHSIVNWTAAPITVNLAHSSSLGLPWGFYAGTADAPDVPLAPIAGPFEVKTFGPAPPRYIWAMATVPAGAPSGAETLVITATDVASPALTVWTSDLLWVGDWVAPPPLGYRC
jgi:hypothetical protein